MTDQEFESWYARIKDGVSAYEKTEHRMAVIAGYFGAMWPETTLTVAQVNEILKLRNKSTVAQVNEILKLRNKR